MPFILVLLFKQIGKAFEIANQIALCDALGGCESLNDGIHQRHTRTGKGLLLASAAAPVPPEAPTLATFVAAG